MSVVRAGRARAWFGDVRTRIDPSTVAALLLGVFAIWSWIQVFRQLGDIQWDFRIYYHAAKADIAGQDPYDPATLARFARRRVLGGYAYPPATLAFFKPFTLASFDSARQIFFCFKTLLLVGLVALWRTRFSDARAALVLYLACLFAFNNTIYVDLRAGNVSLLEQALLWPAFYCYTRGRLAWFCVLVLFASTWKQVPILFLGLLLVELDRKRMMLLLASLAAFAAYLLVSRAAQPDLFAAFLENAAKTNSESKILNPSS
ncbi:MAG: glycosyltransferase family 87 protein, partial [Polyangiaceae bacterium]